MKMFSVVILSVQNKMNIVGSCNGENKCYWQRRSSREAPSLVR